ncbi:MAG: tyrosine-type recombinase/integrase [Thalassotalea sp.]
MAKKTTPLTNTQVKQAKSTDSIYKLSDGEGLQLRIMPSGSKQWLLDYLKPISRKRTSLSLGNFPAVSLADARTKRTQAKELLAKGVDPKEYRDDIARENKIAAGNTLINVAKVWFEVKKTKIAETTSKSLWRNFQNHVFPQLGHRPIDKISAPETIQTLKVLAARGSLETVDKIIGHLNELMNFAVNTGVVHANPLSGIKAAFQSPKSKNMATLKPQELPELMKELSFANIKITTRCLIEFQLHTMVRPVEAAEARWAEIDFENKLWSIPGTRMKKNRDHIVPLSKQVLEILERMKMISFHLEFIFPADRSKTKPSNSETANNALKKRMPFKNRLVAHGMRSLASTTLNEEQWDAQLIEVALAHVDKNTVRSSYNHAAYIEPRRKMMDWWSEHIEKCSRNDLSMLKHLN